MAIIKDSWLIRRTFVQENEMRGCLKEYVDVVVQLVQYFEGYQVGLQVAVEW